MISIALENLLQNEYNFKRKLGLRVTEQKNLVFITSEAIWTFLSFFISH